MKAILKSSVIILLISFSRLSQANELLEIKTVVELAYEQIWSDLNAEAVEVFHTDDFTLLNDGEDFWSNFDVVLYLNRIKKVQSKTMKKANSFEFLEHKIYDDLAWITFYNTRQSSDATSRISETKWLESAFLVKENNQWKFQLLHSSQVRNP